jgi:hypothetical protein
VFFTRAHHASGDCIKMNFVDARRESVAAPRTRLEHDAAVLIFIASTRFVPKSSLHAFDRGARIALWRELP